MERLFEEEDWNYKHVAIPIMIMFSIFLVWASVSKIDEIVRGEGKVIPSGKTKIIQHLEGGIIADILVKEGDIVKKDDVLYELSQAFFTADLKSKQIQLQALKAKAIRLKNEVDFNDELIFPKYLTDSIPNIIANEKSIFENDKKANFHRVQIAQDQLQQKILKLNELKTKLSDLSIELSLEQENMKILDKMYKRKVVSKQKYLEALQKKQSLVTKVSNIKNTIPIVKQEINEASSKLKAIKSDIKSKLLKDLSDVQVQIKDLEQKIKAGLDRNKRKNIISPVDGVIKKIYFNTIGGIIRPGDKVAEITPEDDALVIEAKIKTSDRALIWIGQKVKIAITAYDTSKYGLIDGKVTYISPDSETDERSGKSYYKVLVNASVLNFGKNSPILPGMVANVNILVGKRTIMYYILRPLKDMARNSLTEH